MVCIHSVGVRTCQVYVSSQSGDFDLFYILDRSNSFFTIMNPWTKISLSNCILLDYLPFSAEFFSEFGRLSLHVLDIFRFFGLLSTWFEISFRNFVYTSSRRHHVEFKFHGNQNILPYFRAKFVTRLSDCWTIKRHNQCQWGWGGGWGS